MSSNTPWACIVARVNNNTNPLLTLDSSSYRLKHILDHIIKNSFQMHILGFVSKHSATAIKFEFVVEIWIQYCRQNNFKLQILLAHAIVWLSYFLRYD